MSLTATNKRIDFPLLARILKVCAPILLSIIAGYGAVQYAQGANHNRLTNLEQAEQQKLTRDEFNSWATQQRDSQDKISAKQDQLLTREEFKIFSDQQRDQLRSLQEDVRSLRPRR